MRSLRWRLIITTATATALILGLCGIVLDASIHRSLTADFDASLEQQRSGDQPLIYQCGIKANLDPKLTSLREFTTSSAAGIFRGDRDLNTQNDDASQSAWRCDAGLLPRHDSIWKSDR